MSAVERSLNLETAEWTITFPANLPCGSDDWLRDLGAAAPIIEAAVRERVATEIEAQVTPNWAEGFRYMFRLAAAIARGQS